MKSVVNGIKNLVTFFKFAIRIINQILNNTTRVIRYMVAVLPKIGTMILTLPPFIQIFASMTVGICVAYLLIGRDHGKSDRR